MWFTLLPGGPPSSLAVPFSFDGLDPKVLLSALLFSVCAVHAFLHGLHWGARRGAAASVVAPARS